jgi:hypothetical protein
MCFLSGRERILYFILFYLICNRSTMYSISQWAGKSSACGLSDVMKFPPVTESLTPDYRSVGHLHFSLRGILSLDRDCRSGFEWDCSLTRCLLLLLWMTSWTVGMPRSEWIIALVIYHGAFTIALNSFDWNLWMIAMLDLDAQPHSSRP